ncbi:MAG: rod shape-determining protein MreC [Actinomycetota bacterium]
MLVITLVTASLATITIDYKQGSTGPLGEVGRAALSVIAPMQEGVTKAFRPVSRFFSTLAALPSLRSERDRLRERVRELENDRSTLVSAQQRIDALEALFNIKNTLLADMETTGANVIGSGVSNFEWSLTIDIGSRDDVHVNDAVISGNALVGHIVEVTPFGSKVELIIDPNSRVAARLTAARDSGLLVGRGPQDMSMQISDVHAQIGLSDGVETAGYQNGLYPAGIPIGTVASIEHTPGALTKTVTVHPSVDFSTLDYVLVVLGPRSR